MALRAEREDGGEVRKGKDEDRKAGERNTSLSEKETGEKHREREGRTEEEKGEGRTETTYQFCAASTRERTAMKTDVHDKRTHISGRLSKRTESKGKWPAKQESK